MISCASRWHTQAKRFVSRYLYLTKTLQDNTSLRDVLIDPTPLLLRNQELALGRGVDVQFDQADAVGHEQYPKFLQGVRPLDFDRDQIAEIGS